MKAKIVRTMKWAINCQLMVKTVWHKGPEWPKFSMYKNILILSKKIEKKEHYLYFVYCLSVMDISFVSYGIRINKPTNGATPSPYCINYIID